MTAEFTVVCECGEFERGYDTHPEASAAQAGHSAHCFGNRTMITDNGNVT